VLDSFNVGSDEDAAADGQTAEDKLRSFIDTWVKPLTYKDQQGIVRENSTTRTSAQAVLNSMVFSILD